MFLAAVMMMSMTAVSFTSCSSDDDVENYDSVKKQIVGTWNGRVVTGFISGSSGTKYYYADATITITNTTFHIVTENYDQTFNYTIKKNGEYYVFDFGSDNYVLIFQVSGNTLSIVNSDSSTGLMLVADYTKQ